MLPKLCSRPKAPPIKLQGIKTKLVPFIFANIQWPGKGRWIEPFLGSGVVLFNLQPETALVADTNQYVIAVYRSIQSGELSASGLRNFLELEGSKLMSEGEAYYYAVRDRFNHSGSVFDFIFLNRAAFNGVIRFNAKGKFNVPFCKKPQRFRPAYITKICNQVDWVAQVLKDKDWTFVVQDWRTTLAALCPDDFVYLDPPYLGRHTDYFSRWSDADAAALAIAIKTLSCGFAYSMWKQNQYRVNEHLSQQFAGYPCLTYEHYYHVGATEARRNAMQEALIISPRFWANSASGYAQCP